MPPPRAVRPRPSRSTPTRPDHPCAAVSSAGRSGRSGSSISSSQPGIASPRSCQAASSTPGERLAVRQRARQRADPARELDRADAASRGRHVGPRLGVGVGHAPEDGSSTARPWWKAIERRVASIVPNGCPTQASPQSMNTGPAREDVRVVQVVVLQRRGDARLRELGAGLGVRRQHRAQPRGVLRRQPCRRSFVLELVDRAARACARHADRAAGRRRRAPAGVDVRLQRALQLAVERQVAGHDLGRRAARRARRARRRRRRAAAPARLGRRRERRGACSGVELGEQRRAARPRSGRRRRGP